MRFEEQQTARKASEQRLHVFGLTEPEIAALTQTNHNSRSDSLAVRAPMDGTVIEKHAVVGELTEPGKDVMVVADLNNVWMWAGVYERDLQTVMQKRPVGGIPVEIVVPAFPDAVFRGQMNQPSVELDSTAVLASPRRCGQYTAAAALGTLPAR